mmetsp:Transcript_8349/g.18177  ORF Transcript_8349/g.18177 Transcript_8349/m.18177 type:complete len:238 (-) Transcript_8349:299-1012(-)
MNSTLLGDCKCNGTSQNNQFSFLRPKCQVAFQRYPSKRTNSIISSTTNERYLIRPLPSQIAHHAVNHHAKQTKPHEITTRFHHRPRQIGIGIRHGPPNQLRNDQRNINQNRLLGIESHLSRLIGKSRPKRERHEEQNAEDGHGLESLHYRTEEDVIEHSEGGYAVVDVRAEGVAVDEGEDVGYAALDAIGSLDFRLFEGFFVFPFRYAVVVVGLAEYVQFVGTSVFVVLSFVILFAE